MSRHNPAGGRSLRPLRHGYTNHTAGDGAVVVKTYRGPDAEIRLEREHALLAALRGHVPVPPVRGRAVAGAARPTSTSRGRRVRLARPLGRRFVDSAGSLTSPCRLGGHGT